MGDYYSCVAEWDWLVFEKTWRTLHAPRGVFDPEKRSGMTECGRRGWLSIPGLFSRDPEGGLPRCRRCCQVTGMPQGIGSPKNSTECKPIARKRARRYA